MHGLIQQSASIHAFYHSAVVWLHVISSAFDPHLPQICTPQIQAPDGSAIAGHSMVPFFGIQGLASFVDPKNSLNEMRLISFNDCHRYPNMSKPSMWVHSQPIFHTHSQIATLHKIMRPSAPSFLLPVRSKQFWHPNH